MVKYRTYEFNPVNPEKYTGSDIPIIMRSSWEIEFAKHCDLLPSVLSWGYEMVQIPYSDPLTGKQKIYIPDFFVKVAQADGYSRDYVFEIKPIHEQKDGYAKNRTDAALIARNNAKWIAAAKWADRHSSEFVILNEQQLFLGHDARSPRKNPIKTWAHTHSTQKTNKQNTYKRIAKKISQRTSRKATSNRVGLAARVSKSRKAKKI